MKLALTIVVSVILAILIILRMFGLIGPVTHDDIGILIVAVCAAVFLLVKFATLDDQHTKLR